MYSEKPSDWYFDISITDDVYLVGLSTERNSLDEELTASKLPEPIADLLFQAGIDTECEAMESVFEFNTVIYGVKPKQELQEELERLGFNKGNFFDC